MRQLIGAMLVASVAVNALLVYLVTAKPAPPGDPPPRRPPTETTTTQDMLVVMRTNGGLLEVSTVSSEERFESTTSHTVFGVPVGATVARIRVPAVYRYHIPLDKDWTLRLSGKALVVIAPLVRPSLPVAIQTGQIQAYSNGVWSPYVGGPQILSLLKSISANLADKAGSEQMLLLQRESARKTVTEFVQKWVVAESQWKGLKAPVVLVFFKGEPLGMSASPLLSM